MELVHDLAAASYRLLDGEATVSRADYHDTGGAEGTVRVFHHTFTVPAHRGNGHAEQVVAFALNDARESGLKVAATCWFVADYLRDHDEYADLVA